MLHTELTNCKQFTVIDIGEFAKRHAIPLSNDAETINTLLRRARATAILRTAITKYDPASRKLEGGGFIPGGKHGLKTATTGNAEVIMFKIGLDLRVVDSKTGQVLNATSVEEGGKSYITKVDVVGLQPEQGPFLQTPRGDLRFMQNFDLEGTLRAAIKKAVKELAEKSQANRRAA
jgi:curli biogenesis system outer membrane secretion channel CsgG